MYEFRTLADEQPVIGLACGRGLTEQAHKDVCDVNLILKRFSKTGVLDHVMRSEPHYGDFVDVVDYRTGLDHVRAAEASFKALPSKVRNRFENDPSKFLEFVGDPENLDEMVSLGLATKRQAKPVGEDPPPEAVEGRSPPQHS